MTPVPGVPASGRFCAASGPKLSYCASTQRSLRDPPGSMATVPCMDEFRARRVVDSLRDRGVNAHQLRRGNGKFGIRLPLPATS
jgi:hypothetical protein